MSKISEFFGLNCNDDSLNFETAMRTQTVRIHSAYAQKCENQIQM